VKAANSIEQAAIRKQIESGLNVFPTSSMGRCLTLSPQSVMCGKT